METGATKLVEKGLNFIENSIDKASVKIRRHIFSKKVLKPFNIYLFTVRLYWLLCFKLDNLNMVQSKEQYYASLIEKNFLSILLSKETSSKINPSQSSTPDLSQTESGVSGVPGINKVNQFIDQCSDNQEFISRLKNKLDHDIHFISEIIKYVKDKKPDLLNTSYINNSDVLYEDYVNQSILQQFKNAEWFNFVNTWNNNQCTYEEWEYNKAKADRLNDFVTASSSAGTTAKTNMGYPFAEVPEPTGMGPVQLKLTKRPKVFSTRCTIKDDLTLENDGNTNYNVNSNFMSYSFIESDLIYILTIVINRVLYGDMDNCYFDWYNDTSGQRSYRGDTLIHKTNPSDLDASEFILNNLVKFNKYISYLINTNTPGLAGIIKLHSKVLMEKHSENDYEFIKSHHNNNKKITMKGTLSTLQILTTNMFDKFIKETKLLESHQTSDNKCTHKDKDSSKEPWKTIKSMGINLYTSSLAWKTLFYLKKMLLFLYQSALTLNDHNFVTLLKKDDIDSNKITISYSSEVNDKVINPSSENIKINHHSNKKNQNHNNDILNLIYIPSLDINTLHERINSIKSDIWLGRGSDTSSLDINKNILESEYLSVVYQGLCFDITEDEARRKMDEITNDAEENDLMKSLNAEAENVSNIVNNMVLKGGITTKNMNEKTIKENISNFFSELWKDCKEVFKSAIKSYQMNVENIKESAHLTQKLISGDNLRNIYNLIKECSSDLLSENYLSFIAKINTLTNYKFEFTHNNPPLLNVDQLIKRFSISDSQIIQSIQPPSYSNYNPLLTKYIMIGCIKGNLNDYKKIDNNIIKVNLHQHWATKYSFILLRVKDINIIEANQYDPDIENTIKKIFTINDRSDNYSKLSSYYNIPYICDNCSARRNDSRTLQLHTEKLFIEQLAQYIYFYEYQNYYLNKNNKSQIISMILNTILDQTDELYYKFIVSFKNSESKNSIDLSRYKLNCGPIKYSQDFGDSVQNRNVYTELNLSMGDQRLYEKTNDTEKGISSNNLIYPLNTYKHYTFNSNDYYKSLILDNNPYKTIPDSFRTKDGVININTVNCISQITDDTLSSVITYDPLKLSPCYILRKVIVNENNYNSVVHYKLPIRKLLTTISSNMNILTQNIRSDGTGGYNRNKTIYKNKLMFGGGISVTYNHLKIVLDNLLGCLQEKHIKIGNESIPYLIDDNFNDIYNDYDYSEYIFLENNQASRNINIFSPIINDIKELLYKYTSDNPNRWDIQNKAQELLESSDNEGDDDDDDDDDDKQIDSDETRDVDDQHQEGSEIVDDEDGMHSDSIVEKEKIGDVDTDPQGDGDNELESVHKGGKNYKSHKKIYNNKKNKYRTSKLCKK